MENAIDLVEGIVTRTLQIVGFVYKDTLISSNVRTKTDDIGTRQLSKVEGQRFRPRITTLSGLSVRRTNPTNGTATAQTSIPYALILL